VNNSCILISYHFYRVTPQPTTNKPFGKILNICQSILSSLSRLSTLATLQIHRELLIKIKSLNYKYLGKLEKWSLIPPEIVDIKHWLWIWQIWEILTEPCINSIPWSEVGYATWHRHPSTCQNNNLFRILNQADNIFQCVNTLQLFPCFWFSNKLPNTLP